MEKVRIGIIGCGGIANAKHMPSLKKLPQVEMVAFCDIIEERAQKAAAEYGVPGAKVFTDYKELLKLDLDVVHVLTPNKQHSFITVDALERMAAQDFDYPTDGLVMSSSWYKAENKYRLEISYFRADENEIIKNILSLGSYVVVLEPRTIQKEVYRRIKTASKLYG